MVVSTRSRSHKLKLQQSRSSISWGEAKRRAAEKGIILKDPRLRIVSLTRKQSKIYVQALQESEGFDVPHFPGVTEGFLVRQCGETSAEDLETFAMEAIRHYKTHVDENADPAFVKVVRANYRISGAYWNYYLTFEAMDHAQLQTYEALITRRFRKITVDFSRLQKTSPM